MKNFVLLFTFLLMTISVSFTPQMAFALSCLKPDIKRQFNGFDTKGGRYYLVNGYFSGAAPKIDRPDNYALPKTNPVTGKMTFQGVQLGSRNDVPFTNKEVEVELTCLAAWCGSIHEDQVNRLYYLEETEKGFHLSIGPCDFWPEATAKNVKTLKNCLAKGQCDASPSR